MRYLATISVGFLLIVQASAQSPKPKQPAGKKTTPAVATSGSKGKATTKSVGMATNSSRPKQTAANPLTASSKAKPVVAAVKKPDEKTAWDKAAAVEDPIQKVTAIRKFLTTFPRSERAVEAREIIASTLATLANDKMATGDLAAAAELYKKAVAEAPSPIGVRLFTDSLVKIPVNLYFRGGRAEAFEIAKLLENKSGSDAGQLLAIASFYMSVENGTEARRIADLAVTLDPQSSRAYETLALAHRIDFRLDDSASSYARALELDPESLSARRGLAEMRRSAGRADEAAELYREILARDAASIPAQTGLILSLFDAEKRSEAEAEMAKSLEAAPGNVILLAGAAYWYAVHNEGERAIDLAQKAIAAEPRFIWSHIALARGQLNRKDPLGAEKTLLAARRYGNFPTLEYEIASARAAAGLYREAAEELAKSFSVTDGVITTNLGGRVKRESQNFTELVGIERRASIFAPTAADSPENAARLTALLELKQELATARPRGEVVARAADVFVNGDDRMKVHRQIYAATQLLAKKAGTAKALEIARAAPPFLDAGLDVATPSAAVLGNEMYENRALAAARGEYAAVPDVPRTTLSVILRGQIEELTGWASYLMDEPSHAVVRLKRAVSVLPMGSAYWRSSTWRLGTALSTSGRDAEALEWLIKSYKSGTPNAFGYGVIEGLYRRVNNSTDGLEALIGQNPSVAMQTAAIQAKPTPETTPAPIPAGRRVRPPSIPLSVPIAAATPTPQPTVAALTAPILEPTADPTPETTPPSAVVEPSVTPSPTPSIIQVAEKPVRSSPQPGAASERPLFPPIIITIPVPEANRATSNPKPLPPDKETDAAASRVEQVEVTPCRLTVSEPTLNLRSGGPELALIVGRDDDEPLADLTAVSTSPSDVRVRRQEIEGVRGRALFVLSSISAKTGVFQVKFSLACGSRSVVVNVR